MKFKCLSVKLSGETDATIIDAQFISVPNGDANVISAALHLTVLGDASTFTNGQEYNVSVEAVD